MPPSAQTDTPTSASDGGSPDREDALLDALAELLVFNYLARRAKDDGEGK